MSLRPITYVCFSLADHCIWLLIILLPDTVAFQLLKNRPWKCLRIKANNKILFSLTLRVKSLLKQRCYYAKRFSSCLSRSTLGRILLDILEVQNELHLGMTIDKENSKVPHAWLTSFNQNLTPGINENVDCHILTL